MNRNVSTATCGSRERGIHVRYDTYKWAVYLSMLIDTVGLRNTCLLEQKVRCGECLVNSLEINPEPELITW